MQRVDLYQAQFRPSRDPTDARHMGVWLLLVVLVLGAVSGVLAWRGQAAQQRLADAQERRDQVQQRMTEVRSRLESARAERETPTGELERLRAELAAKRRLLDYLEEGPLAATPGFSAYLDGLARHVVSGLWLERVEIDAGGDGLRLDGHARAPKHVPAFVAALGGSDAFRGQRFRTVALERPEDDAGRIAFTLASQAAANDRGAGDER